MEKSDIDVASLWKSYCASHETVIRDRLVEHYLPLVNIIAGRLAINLPTHVDRDDLISSGFFGLLDAIERFDYERGNKFETYAGVRIRGSMLDYLRSRDWIPVSLRQKIRKYEQTLAKLEGELGRSATDEEIADSLEITVDELHSLVTQLNVATIIPLDDYIKSEASHPGIEDPSGAFEARELQNVLADAIAKLPEKEQQVVSLYYYEELTMKEISLIMKLSEARICQLHTKAVFRLRGALGRFKEDIF